MKKTLLTLLVLAPFTAHAAPITYGSSVTFASDYAFRGISQTDESLALQADITAEYGSVWGSTVDFNNTEAGSLEVDLAAGYTHALSNEVDLDAGVIHYTYPGSDSDLKYDYTELFVSLSTGFSLFNSSLSFNYSPEYFGESGEFYYYNVAVDKEVRENLTLAASVGYSDIDENITFGTPDYTDWSVGASYALDQDFNVSLNYVDTDLSKSECADGCEARVILSVSKAF
jgi:uncharacterized protein (TIGR02001 family)